MDEQHGVATLPTTTTNTTTAVATTTTTATTAVATTNTTSLTSSGNNHNPIISVKIIGTSMVDDENGKYTMYKMSIVTKQDQWEVCRRYSEFEKMLHEPLQWLNIKGFPSKTILPSAQFNYQCIDERQDALQKYIDKLLKVPNIHENPVLQKFLNPLYMPAVKDLKNVASIKGLLKCSYPKTYNKQCCVLMYETKLYIYVSQQASHPDYEVNLLTGRINHEQSSEKLTIKITDDTNNWCILNLRPDKVNNGDEWLRLLTHVRVSADPMNRVYTDILRKREHEDVEKQGVMKNTPLKTVLHDRGAVRSQTERIERPTIEPNSPTLYRYEPDSEKNIVLSNSGEISAATKTKLLDKLCDSNFGIYTPTAISLSKNVDINSHVQDLTDQIKAQAFLENTYEKSNFVVAFMYTFNSFMKPQELLNVLIQRFMHPPSRPVRIQELNYKEQNGITKREELATDPTRARIIEVLCTWLEVHFYDFLEDEALAQQLINFIESNISLGEGICSAGSNVLKDLIKKKLKTMPPVPDSSIAPKLILPLCPTGGHFDLYDLSPIEVARQLTIKHLGMFKKIALKEFLSQKWNKSDSQRLAPRIIEFMKEFNKCSNWVSTYCTVPETPKERAEIITKFIHIASHCKSIQNYHTTMTIISGLNTAAVSRLKLSWGLVNSKDNETFQQISQLMSPNSNWSNYRNLLCKDPPLLPYLGLFLADLTFLEDGNPDYVGPYNLINFEKWSTESCIFKNIQKFQSSLYHLMTDKEIQKYLKHLTIIENDKELFNISLAREPRTIDKKS